MPISYTIDVENGLVVSVGHGVVSGEDLLGYLGSIARDPEVPRPLRDLHDLSRVTQFDVGSDVFKTIVAMFQANPQGIQDARLAIIAPEDHVFGLYRMFEMLAEHAPPVEELRQKGLAPNAEVFREYNEAREWLLADSS